MPQNIDAGIPKNVHNNHVTQLFLLLSLTSNCAAIQTHTQTSGLAWHYSKYNVCVCVYVCMCMCVRERETAMAIELFLFMGSLLQARVNVVCDSGHFIRKLKQ